MLLGCPGCHDRCRDLAVRARRRLTACLLTTALTTATPAGCSLPANPHLTSPLAASGPSPGTLPGTPVVLRLGDQAVTVTLTDTPPSRQFAAMLPLTVQLTDAWGQAKAGPLPRSLTADGGTPVHDPTPGELYFWPSSGVIAVYYDDLGQTVPDPGLVRLGVVKTGLDTLAEAGNRITIRIEPAVAAGSVLPHPPRDRGALNSACVRRPAVTPHGGDCRISTPDGRKRA
ncbi:cyclophilin-like fold protein [Nonomuraea sp. NPDC050451]|uniref:cyclophilin-like fold protein n=1 Tax=Nonomuraea sp. NPDC050451 TaxID=3364364 RepID=UPI0037AA280B